MRKKMKRHLTTLVPCYTRRRNRDIQYSELDPSTYDPVKFYDYEIREICKDIRFYVDCFGHNPDSWEEMGDAFLSMTKLGDKKAWYHYTRLKYYILDDMEFVEGLKEAAGNNIMEAQLDLVSYYRSKEDNENERMYLKIAAENGDVESQTEYGEMLYDDYKEGISDGAGTVKWLKKAAKAGAERAIELLADIYEEGELVEKDIRIVKKLRGMIKNRPFYTDGRIPL